MILVIAPRFERRYAHALLQEESYIAARFHSFLYNPSGSLAGKLSVSRDHSSSGHSRTSSSVTRLNKETVNIVLLTLQMSYPSPCTWEITM